MHKKEQVPQALLSLTNWNLSNCIIPTLLPGFKVCTKKKVPPKSSTFSCIFGKFLVKPILAVKVIHKRAIKAAVFLVFSVFTEVFKAIIQPGASSWGNVLKPLHIASYSFITLFLLCFPLFIFIHITTGKKQNCCQLVVLAGILLSALR